MTTTPLHSKVQTPNSKPHKTKSLTVTTKMSPFLLLLLFFYAAVTFSTAVPTHFSTATIPKLNPNPLTPKASLLRYWSSKISNNRPKPDFLLSKASPLSTVDFALYLDIVRTDFHLLSSRLDSFCTSAHLLCFPSLSPPVDQLLSTSPDSHFSVYDSINFTNYGNFKKSGVDSFKNYSDDQNVPLDTFRRYSRRSENHKDGFSFYAPNGNVVTANFTSYATSATGGSGEFTAYDQFSNVPDLKFSNYDTDAGGGRTQTFSSYSDDSNAGDQSFTGYGRNSDGVPIGFKSYAKNSNVMGSSFSGYGETEKDPKDSFESYGFNGNVPQNNFKSYADGAKGEDVLQKFSSYRDQANVGDDSFSSYLKGTSKDAKATFDNYGQSANVGTDTFKKYGENAVQSSVGFKTYGVNSTFTDYRKEKEGSTTFADYRNTSSAEFANIASVSDGIRSGRLVNRWVEPGKFFRESRIRTGTVMPMPDIRDKMANRSFLPRSIAARLPFSTARMDELNRVFNATLDTSFAKSMSDTVAECERKPSRGEDKLCATSIEDMIDFATSVLGRDVVVRSAESAVGWSQDIMIGKVRGINGGSVTRSVSCHQSLFPYMVYYCHSVPRVRVYEAEILAVETEKVINHGVAICHLDTSDWSATHAAFVALGPGPGKIEVCHWIFEGDMTWAVADS